MCIIQKLEDRCSRHLNYVDLIEVGDTFKRLRVPNIPQQIETYTAIESLAVNLLDPIIDEFGSIDITYGFCSNELSKNIKARIAPSLDQHASFELNSRGSRICKRDGIAVDFYVTNYAQNMNVIADWIVDNLPFDRLYFYGKDRPLHLSYSNNPVRKSYAFSITDSGMRVPRPYKR